MSHFKMANDPFGSVPPAPNEGNEGRNGPSSTSVEGGKNALETLLGEHADTHRLVEDDSVCARKCPQNEMEEVKAMLTCSMSTNTTITNGMSKSGSTYNTSSMSAVTVPYDTKKNAYHNGNTTSTSSSSPSVSSTTTAQSKHPNMYVLPFKRPISDNSSGSSSATLAGGRTGSTATTTTTTTGVKPPPPPQTPPAYANSRLGSTSSPAVATTGESTAPSKTTAPASAVTAPPQPSASSPPRTSSTTSVISVTTAVPGGSSGGCSVVAPSDRSGSGNRAPVKNQRHPGVVAEDDNNASAAQPQHHHRNNNNNSNSNSRSRSRSTSLRSRRRMRSGGAPGSNHPEHAEPAPGNRTTTTTTSAAEAESKAGMGDVDAGVTQQEPASLPPLEFSDPILGVSAPLVLMTPRHARQDSFCCSTTSSNGGGSRSSSVGPGGNMSSHHHPAHHRSTARHPYHSHFEGSMTSGAGNVGESNRRSGAPSCATSVILTSAAASVVTTPVAACVRPLPPLTTGGLPIKAGSSINAGHPSSCEGGDNVTGGRPVGSTEPVCHPKNDVPTTDEQHQENKMKSSTSLKNRHSTNLLSTTTTTPPNTVHPSLPVHGNVWSLQEEEVEKEDRRRGNEMEKRIEEEGEQEEEIQSPQWATTTMGPSPSRGETVRHSMLKKGNNNNNNNNTTTSNPLKTSTVTTMTTFLPLGNEIFHVPVFDEDDETSLDPSFPQTQRRRRSSSKAERDGEGSRGSSTPPPPAATALLSSSSKKSRQSSSERSITSRNKNRRDSQTRRRRKESTDGRTGGDVIMMVDDEDCTVESLLFLDDGEEDVGGLFPKKNRNDKDEENNNDNNNNAATINRSMYSNKNRNKNSNDKQVRRGSSLSSKSISWGPGSPHHRRRDSSGSSNEKLAVAARESPRLHPRQKAFQNHSPQHHPGEPDQGTEKDQSPQPLSQPQSQKRSSIVVPMSAPTPVHHGPPSQFTSVSASPSASMSGSTLPQPPTNITLSSAGKAQQSGRRRKMSRSGLMSPSIITPASTIMNGGGDEGESAVASSSSAGTVKDGAPPKGSLKNNNSNTTTTTNSPPQNTTPRTKQANPIDCTSPTKTAVSSGSPGGTPGVGSGATASASAVSFHRIHNNHSFPRQLDETEDGEATTSATTSANAKTERKTRTSASATHTSPQEKPNEKAPNPYTPPMLSKSNSKSSTGRSANHPAPQITAAGPTAGVAPIIAVDEDLVLLDEEDVNPLSKGKDHDDGCRKPLSSNSAEERGGRTTTSPSTTAVAGAVDLVVDVSNPSVNTAFVTKTATNTTTTTTMTTTTSTTTNTTAHPTVGSSSPPGATAADAAAGDASGRVQASASAGSLVQNPSIASTVSSHGSSSSHFRGSQGKPRRSRIATGEVNPPPSQPTTTATTGSSQNNGGGKGIASSSSSSAPAGGLASHPGSQTQRGSGSGAAGSTGGGGAAGNTGGGGAGVLRRQDSLHHKKSPTTTSQSCHPWFLTVAIQSFEGEPWALDVLDDLSCPTGQASGSITTAGAATAGTGGAIPAGEEEEFLWTTTTTTTNSTTTSSSALAAAAAAAVIAGGGILKRAGDSVPDGNLASSPPPHVGSGAPEPSGGEGGCDLAAVGSGAVSGVLEETIIVDEDGAPIITSQELHRSLRTGTRSLDALSPSPPTPPPHLAAGSGGVGAGAGAGPPPPPPLPLSTASSPDGVSASSTGGMKHIVLHPPPAALDPDHPSASFSDPNRVLTGEWGTLQQYVRTLNSKAFQQKSGGLLGRFTNVEFTVSMEPCSPVSAASLCPSPGGAGSPIQSPLQSPSVSASGSSKTFPVVGQNGEILSGEVDRNISTNSVGGGGLPAGDGSLTQNPTMIPVYRLKHSMESTLFTVITPALESVLDRCTSAMVLVYGATQEMKQLGVIGTPADCGLLPHAIRAMMEGFTEQKMAGLSGNARSGGSSGVTTVTTSPMGPLHNANHSHHHNNNGGGGGYPVNNSGTSTPNSEDGGGASGAYNNSTSTTCHPLNNSTNMMGNNASSTASHRFVRMEVTFVAFDASKVADLLDIANRDVELVLKLAPPPTPFEFEEEFNKNNTNSVHTGEGNHPSSGGSTSASSSPLGHQAGGDGVTASSSSFSNMGTANTVGGIRAGGSSSRSQPATDAFVLYARAWPCETTNDALSALDAGLDHLSAAESTILQSESGSSLLFSLTAYTDTGRSATLHLLCLAEDLIAQSWFVSTVLARCQAIPEEQEQSWASIQNTPMPPALHHQAATMLVPALCFGNMFLSILVCAYNSSSAVNRLNRDLSLVLNGYRMRTIPQVTAVSHHSSTRSLPYPWQEKYTPDGRRYFVNPVTHCNTLEDPRLVLLRRHRRERRHSVGGAGSSTSSVSSRRRSSTGRRGSSSGARGGGGLVATHGSIPLQPEDQNFFLQVLQDGKATSSGTGGSNSNSLAQISSSTSSSRRIQQWNDEKENAQMVNGSDGNASNQSGGGMTILTTMNGHGTEAWHGEQNEVRNNADGLTMRVPGYEGGTTMTTTTTPNEACPVNGMSGPLIGSASASSISSVIVPSSASLLVEDCPPAVRASGGVAMLNHPSASTSHDARKPPSALIGSTPTTNNTTVAGLSGSEGGSMTTPGGDKVAGDHHHHHQHPLLPHEQGGGSGATPSTSNGSGAPQLYGGANNPGGGGAPHTSFRGGVPSAPSHTSHSGNNDNSPPTGLDIGIVVVNPMNTPRVVIPARNQSFFDALVPPPPRQPLQRSRSTSKATTRRRGGGSSRAKQSTTSSRRRGSMASPVSAVSISSLDGKDRSIGSPPYRQHRREFSILSRGARGEEGGIGTVALELLIEAAQVNERVIESIAELDAETVSVEMMRGGALEKEDEKEEKDNPLMTILPDNSDDDDGDIEEEEEEEEDVRDEDREEFMEREKTDGITPLRRIASNFFGKEGGGMLDDADALLFTASSPTNEGNAMPTTSTTTTTIDMEPPQGAVSTSESQEKGMPSTQSNTADGVVVPSSSDDTMKKASGAEGVGSYGKRVLAQASTRDRMEHEGGDPYASSAAAGGSGRPGTPLPVLIPSDLQDLESLVEEFAAFFRAARQQEREAVKLRREVKRLREERERHLQVLQAYATTHATALPEPLPDELFARTPQKRRRRRSSHGRQGSGRKQKNIVSNGAKKNKTKPNRKTETADTAHSQHEEEKLGPRGSCVASPPPSA